MAIPSISNLANPTLSNPVAIACLKKLDPEFNEIISPESPAERFSEQVLSRYYHLCRNNHLISDLHPPTWAIHHFNAHPQMRMAAIAEVVNEICHKVLEEKRALTYRVAQIHREILDLSEREIVIDPCPLTISVDHLMSLEREIALLREERQELAEENARLKRENFECKKALSDIHLGDPIEELREKIAILEAQNLELWNKLTGGAITTESPLRQLSTPKPPR
ncbi:MAG: hypothetical protein NTX49_07065 [Chlamydiae bacterium]|nr:hypothetical protein [Chlamydiota bacterium]